jgi:hypothetical protein
MKSLSARNFKQSKTSDYPERIKQAGKVPIGDLRNKLPGAAPCTSRLRENGKGFQGEERWQGYAIYG